MTVAIHQPNFMPWLGYFYKMIKSDCFVLLDNVKFSKESYINRAKIKTPQGELWLTVPVVKVDILNKYISEVDIFRKQSELPRMCKTIRMNYSKAKYFKDYYESFESIILNSDDNLCRMNVQLIQWVREILNIETPLHLASSFGTVENENPTHRLIRITKHLNGVTYLSGKGGFGYQDESQFQEAGIDVRAANFTHPEYDQLWGRFVSGLSILDLIFNCGANSKKIICSHNE